MPVSAEDASLTFMPAKRLNVISFSSSSLALEDRSLTWQVPKGHTAEPDSQLQPHNNSRVLSPYNGAVIQGPANCAVLPEPLSTTDAQQNVPPVYPPLPKAKRAPATTNSRPSKRAALSAKQGHSIEPQLCWSQHKHRTLFCQHARVWTELAASSSIWLPEVPPQDTCSRAAPVHQLRQQLRPKPPPSLRKSGRLTRQHSRRPLTAPTRLNPWRPAAVQQLLLPVEPPPNPQAEQAFQQQQQQQMEEEAVGQLTYVQQQHPAAGAAQQQQHQEEEVVVAERAKLTTGSRKSADSCATQQVLMTPSGTATPGDCYQVKQQGGSHACRAEAGSSSSGGSRLGAQSVCGSPAAVGAGMQQQQQQQQRLCPVNAEQPQLQQEGRETEETRSGGGGLPVKQHAPWQQQRQQQCMGPMPRAGADPYGWYQQQQQQAVTWQQGAAALLNLQQAYLQRLASSSGFSRQQQQQETTGHAHAAAGGAVVHTTSAPPAAAGAAPVVAGQPCTGPCAGPAAAGAGLSHTAQQQQQQQQQPRIGRAYIKPAPAEAAASVAGAMAPADAAAAKGAPDGVAARAGSGLGDPQAGCGIVAVTVKDEEGLADSQRQQQQQQQQQQLLLRAEEQQRLYYQQWQAWRQHQLLYHRQLLAQQQGPQQGAGSYQQPGAQQAAALPQQTQVPSSSSRSTQQQAAGGTAPAGSRRRRSSSSDGGREQQQGRGTARGGAGAVKRSAEDHPSSAAGSSSSRRGRGRRGSGGTGEEGAGASLSRGRDSWTSMHIAYKQSLSKRGRFVVRRSRIAQLGLYTTEALPKGELLLEYCGEVCRRTVADLREARYKAAGLGNYFFAINRTYVVDATLSGNVTRFINHSCEPNCEARVLTVNGQQRVFLSTAQDIPAGEELTYDYKLDTGLLDKLDRGAPAWEDLVAASGLDLVRCGCGAPRCRVYI